MSNRGRKPGFTMSNEHRAKIQNSNILNALIEHVQGEREMSSTQVTAAIALMKKVLPDLQSATIEHSGSISTRPDKMTDEELENIAASGNEGPRVSRPSQAHYQEREER